MKVRVVEKEAKRRLPMVGEAWRYSNEETVVYIRISDVDGRKLFSHLNPDFYFFSVKISNGMIYNTVKNNNTIEILEPIDGELVFKVKE